MNNTIVNCRRTVQPLSSLAWERPLVILFTSPELGPSFNELARAFDRFAGEYHGRLDFITLDITKDGEWARSLQVQFTPAWLVIRQGQVMYQALGLLPGREMSSMFDSVLRSQASATSDTQASTKG